MAFQYAQQAHELPPGLVFRSARLVQGRRLYEVAAAAQISESMLSMLERGLRPLTPEVHARLVRILFGDRRP